MFYPDSQWLNKSRFLNCEKLLTSLEPASSTPNVEKQRDPVLFTHLHRNKKTEEFEAIVVMSANHYEQVFSAQPPLERMLRRQIDREEYIALSDKEFQDLFINQREHRTISPVPSELVYFVVPTIKMEHGYYGTEMKIVNLGKISEVSESPQNYYTVKLDNNAIITLKPNTNFIRWLGL